MTDEKNPFGEVISFYTVDEAVEDGTLADIPGEPVSGKFALGRLVITLGASAALAEADQSPFEFLRRHASGDWSEMSKEDREENGAALLNGDGVFSAYRTKLDCRIWVITEADRSVTTILLPEEASLKIRIG